MRCSDCGRAAPRLCAPLLLGCRPGRRSVGAGSAERRGKGERRQSLSVLDLGREGEPGPGDGRDLASIREERSGSCAETAPFGASCWAPTACANSPGDLGAHACHPAPLGHAVGAGGPAGAGLPRSRRCPGRTPLRTALSQTAAGQQLCEEPPPPSFSAASAEGGAWEAASECCQSGPRKMPGAQEV